MTILLIFIPITFLFRFIPDKWKGYVLFALNLVFYLALDWKFLGLILVQTIISYLIGDRIWVGNTREASDNKRWLVLGISIAVVILGFFKYYGFFVPDDSGLKIVMPLGISYYTFKVISFYSDLYRKKIDDYPSALDYANYICYYPQIICGPIARAPQMLGQFSAWKVKSDLDTDFSAGICLIISGMFKKYVIADRLVSYIDVIFSNHQAYPTLALWMAGFFYTIEIYCDFAGYSEIAIGISRIMGITVDDNFVLPYFSFSIKEFWRRWHVSLSSWLRDYVYISAGGNRKGKVRQKLNVLLTFFVSGLWHGNGVNFIAWGLYHGLLDLIPVKESKNKIIKVLQCIGTFIFVMLGWVMFRADGLINGCTFIADMFRKISLSMFSYNNIVASVMPFTNDYSCLAYLLTALMLITLLGVLEWREYTGKKRNDYARVAIYVVGLVFFAVVGSNSFLYANF